MNIVNERSNERFVRRGAVETGDRDIKQAEIDSELRAVVYEMVQKHGAVKNLTRPLDENASLERKLPVFGEVFVGSGGKVRSGFGSGAVQFRQQVFGGLESEGGHFFFPHVELRRGENACAKKSGSREAWAASRPMGMDFSWGFHWGSFSGMRSRVRRVLAISLSKSRRRISATVI